jgi:hypothetical protein
MTEREPMNRTITITGPFTDDELREFIRLLRAIDEAHPADHYVMGITDPDGSMATGSRLLQEALPPAPGRVTTIWAIPKAP